MPRPDQRQHRGEDRSRDHADRAGGNGAAAGARHLGVDLAVHDIVEGAARAAHHHRAQPEQRDIIKIAPVGEGALVRHRAQRQAADTGPEQQPGADRPVQPHQLQPGAQAARRGFHPIAGHGVGGGLRGKASCGLKCGMASDLKEAGGRTRLFVTAALEPGATVALDEGQTHYLLHVLRAKPGDRVLLFNGRDGEWQAQIAAAAKRGV